MIVWLASYPRSGNTFVRTIFKHAFNISTYSLYNDPLDIGANQETQDVVGHTLLPNNWSIDEARTDKKLWVVKTHDYPVDEEKTIYILRDGREVCVSYRKYLKNYLGQEISLDMVIAGIVPFGSWSNHISAWQPKSRKNTLLLSFEELITNSSQAINKISEFIQIAPIKVDLPTFHELKNINPQFFNTGKIDSWTEQFSQENVMLFWELHKNLMLEYGYSHLAPQWVSEKKSADDMRLALEVLTNAVSSISKERERVERDRLERINKIKELNQYIQSQEGKIRYLQNMNPLQYAIKVWKNRK